MGDNGYFWDRLEAFGETPVLIEGAGEPSDSLNYRDLAARADAWTARYATLLPEIAVGGDKAPLLIALAIAPHLDSIAAYLGALRGGHAVLLCDEKSCEAYHPLRRTYRPNIVVRASEGRCRAELGDPEPVAIAPDTRVLLSTSGSTGMPKLVRLSGRNLQSNALSIIDYLEITPSDRAMTSLPFHYSYGMSVLNSYLACGASLVLTESSITESAFWQAFERHRATSMALVPHQFELLSTIGFRNKDLPSLRYITQAGGRLARDRVLEYADLAAEKGWSFFVMYGQTEAAPRMAYVPPDALRENADTVGRPIPGGSLWLADETGAPINVPDRAGELVYQGPNVMMGYAETRAELARPAGSDVLHTGDIAVRTPEGYFRIVGRKKRFVKLYGLRLSLDQMEESLRGQGIEGHCIGVDERLVVLCKALDDALENRIRRYFETKYALPGRDVVVGSIVETPITASNKVDLRTLQSLAMERLAQHDREIRRAGPAGEGGDIRRIIQQATHATQVSDADSFRSLGGDSLSYIQVALALEERLGAVPDRWEDMSVAQLESLKPVVGAKGQVNADIMTRLAAVTLIVVNHITSAAWPVGGGTWVLLMIAGFSFARFGLPSLQKGEPFRTLVKLLWPFLPLYYAILIAVEVLGRSVEPTMWTLTNNLGIYNSGFFVSPNWFVSLYVQVLLFMVTLIALPPVLRLVNRSPWAFGLMATGAALALSLAYQSVEMPGKVSGEAWDAYRFVVRSPFVCLAFFTAGWLLYFSDTKVRKAVAALALIAVTASFPAKEGYQLFIIAGGGLLMLSGIGIAVPHMLSRLLYTAASTTFFVYLLHGIPVHIFKFETTWRDDLGLGLSAVAVVLVSFLISYAAKWLFDVVEGWGIPHLQAGMRRGATIMRTR